MIGYGAVAGPFEMLRAPALAILPALYTKDYGLALTAVSLALLLLRLADGATDVIVGVLSDRTRSRFGPRKPWLLASAPLAILSAWGLYVPGESANIWQFSICYFFFFLSWTFFDIPYTAWSAELARSYEDRSRLALSRGVWTNVGLILLSLIPLLPFLPSTAMTFDALQVMFWVVAIAFPLGVLYACFRVPSGEFVPASRRFRLKETLQAVKGNRPLQAFLAIVFFSDLAIGVGSATFFIFLDTYLGIGASFSLIFITAVAVGTVALKPWQLLLARTSKRTLLLASTGGLVLWGASVVLLVPGEWILPAYIAYMAALYTLQAGRDVALYALIGDIVDHGELRSRANLAGQFTSAWMVIRKFTTAIGPAIGFFITGIAGYDPAAAQNDATAIFGLKAANGYLPALLFLVAAILAIRFGLTPARHRIIARRLAQRAARAARS
ncbi:MAG: MFS transporter [Steroidobacteraceae bacterium]|nr:MFS transporter [Steroidobacteraceae bacterium]